MHKKALEDLSSDCPCDKEEWCFLRELVAHMSLTERNAEQLRLVYDYKFMKSKEEGIDIGNERALREFIDSYSAKFAEVYQDGMGHDELFERVFGTKYIPSEHNGNQLS